jgi:hypothetical protein
VVEIARASAVSRLARSVAALSLPVCAVVTLSGCAVSDDVPTKRFRADETATCLRQEGLLVRLLRLEPPELPVVEIDRAGVTSADILFAASHEEAGQFAQGESGDVDIRGNVLVRWYGNETDASRAAVATCLS